MYFSRFLFIDQYLFILTGKIILSVLFTTFGKNFGSEGLTLRIDDFWNTMYDKNTVLGNI